MSKKVFVGGLSWDTSEEGLSQHFSQAGEIVEAKIIQDRESGRSRGFGFVTFETENHASNAVEQFDGKELDGRTIKVDFAEDKPRSGGFGGGGGNRGGGNRGGAGRGGFGGGRGGDRQDRW